MIINIEIIAIEPKLHINDDFYAKNMYSNGQTNPIPNKNITKYIT